MAHSYQIAIRQLLCFFFWIVTWLGVGFAFLRAVPERIFLSSAAMVRTDALRCFALCSRMIFTMEFQHSSENSVGLHN